MSKAKSSSLEILSRIETHKNTAITLLLLPGFSWLGLLGGIVNFAGCFLAFIPFYCFWMWAFKHPQITLLFLKETNKIKTSPLIMRYLLSPIIDTTGSLIVLPIISLSFTNSLAQNSFLEQTFESFVFTLTLGIYIHLWYFLIAWLIYKSPVILGKTK